MGLDVSLAIQRTLYLEFREPGFAPAPRLEHLVTAGYLGKKVGRGFRTYDASEPVAVATGGPDPEPRRSAARTRTSRSASDGDWVVRRISGASTKTPLPRLRPEIRASRTSSPGPPTAAPGGDDHRTGTRRAGTRAAVAVRRRSGAGRRATERSARLGATTGGVGACRDRGELRPAARRDPITIPHRRRPAPRRRARDTARPRAGRDDDLPAPLPTHGGMMDSHLYRKAAWRLPALAGIAVLRFNTRGTSSAAGTSEGAFDAGEGEGFDLRAAVADADELGLPHPWLVGWSFGTDVVLKHGDIDPVEGAILLSPPLRFDRRRPRPLGRVASTADLPRARARRLPAPRRGARPLRPRAAGRGGRRRGREAPVGGRSTSRSCSARSPSTSCRVAPAARQYDGPMERWNDL